MTYVRHAVINPITLGVLMIATVLGLTTVGAIGIMFAATAIVTASVIASTLGPVRREIDQFLVDRARDEREQKRLKLLAQTGPARLEQYRELRQLVLGVEESDPAEAVRVELQDLLDDFARLAMLHAQYSSALALAASLPSDLQGVGSAPCTASSQIIARRAGHRDACTRRRDDIADQLEAIAQLVRLVAQRTACPRFDDDLDGEIDRRLTELDEIDSAIDQLSA